MQQTHLLDYEANEDEFEAISKDDQALKTESKIELDEATEEVDGDPLFDSSYEVRIKSALDKLKLNSEMFLVCLNPASKRSVRKIC